MLDMKRIPSKNNRHKLSAMQIKSVRENLGMTQRQFAVFGFSESSIRSWETGKTTPRAYTQNLLKVIAIYPQVVLDVLRKIA
jgi:DNA-binding transcriptional regulator YiaG